MEEIEKILERERIIGECVYKFLLSDKCDLPHEVKQEMQANPRSEYGANSFYVKNSRQYLTETYETELTVQIDGEDLTLLIDVTNDSNCIFIYYRESPKALAYEKARAILDEKSSITEKGAPRQWSLQAAERMKNGLLTCRWTLGEFEHICSLYRELMEYEGGALNAGFINGHNPSNYKHGTILEIHATCADALNLAVVNCLLEIFCLKNARIVNENGDYHVTCRIRE